MSGASTHLRDSLHQTLADFVLVEERPALGFPFGADQPDAIGIHIEPGVRPSRKLDDALDRALARLARGIGLERVER